jgi:hypothetical protein
MWQPIETAPKDGTEIDVWGPHGRRCNAWWETALNAPVGAAPLPEGGGWVEDSDMGVTWVLDPQPTHWMPIPEGPTSPPP